MNSWNISDTDFDIAIDKLECYGYELMVENGIISERNAIIYISLIVHDDTEIISCPYCFTKGRTYTLKNNVHKCKRCLRKYTLKTGKYVNNCKLPYAKIFRLAYLIGEKKLTNSCLIAKDLGITQKSAWWLLELIRNANKEISSIKFKNGKESLSFVSKEAVLRLLFSQTNNKI